MGFGSVVCLFSYWGGGNKGRFLVRNMFKQCKTFQNDMLRTIMIVEITSGNNDNNNDETNGYCEK